VDERLNCGRSGKVAVTLGVAVGQEFLQFLVEPEHVSSKAAGGFEFLAASD
jgi:hypothetical protein